MTLTWTQNGKYDDGSAIAGPDFKGFNIYINALPSVSYPASLATNGNYSLDLDSPLLAAIDRTKRGTYTIRMRTIAVVNGNVVESVDSAPYAYTVDPRKPAAPFALAIS